MLTNEKLIELSDTVIKHFSESDWIRLGALTNSSHIIEGHDRLLRSLSWGDNDYDGNVIQVLRMVLQESPDNQKTLEGMLVKYDTSVDAQFISSSEPSGRKIVFSPSVFKVPEKDVNDSLVSVMMPFSAGLDGVFLTLKTACDSLGLTCKKADNIWNYSEVIQDIFSLIFCSNIVICDFTGKNPNVFYEAGIAHTLGKHVIPITQNQDDIPFDLRHHRYIHYLNNEQGLNDLKQKVVERLATLSGKHATNQLP